MPEPKGRKRERPEKATGSPTGAQAEFRRHRSRVAAPSSFAGAQYPPGTLPAGLGAPGGWAFPPSIAVLPQPLAAGMAPPGSLGGHWAPDPGSLGQRLGATLRLSLDLLNASLAGGARLMSGLSGWPGDALACTGGWGSGECVGHPCCRCDRCRLCQDDYDCCCRSGVGVCS
jgi:hypothetical protein